MLNQDRREFIGKSLALAGTAGLLTSSLAGVAHAQTFGAMRRSNRYEDSFIFERKPYSWPNNKSLAIWIAPNVEVWHYDSPVGTGVTPNPYQSRARRHQLRLAGIRHAHRALASG